MKWIKDTKDIANKNDMEIMKNKSTCEIIDKMIYFSFSTLIKKNAQASRWKRKFMAF